MPSKKFGALLCAYCGENPSTPTGDHVLARKLVLERNRADLPKIPCCKNCNNLKSTLELYLASVLPFGNRQSDAHEGLMSAQRRLARNQRLLRDLQKGHESVIDPIEGAETVAVPFQSEILEQYLGWIARGLHYFKWGVRAPAGHRVRSVIPTFEGNKLLIEHLSSLQGKVYRKNLANRALVFDSLTSLKEPLVSVWRFVLFEGLMMAASDGEATPFIWTFIAPPNLIETLEKIFPSHE